MYTLLVVDSDDKLLLILSHALKARGYKVVTLSDGGKVIDTLLKNNPDLLILDIDMGNYDGRTICEEIKKIHSLCHIPIILFSAEQWHDPSETGCPADAFIQKPLSTNFFIEKIAELIAGKQIYKKQNS